MISWIQHHLIRHGRWIFLSLLAVVIVAFVFTIGNTPGCTSANSNYQAQLFYGYDLNAPADIEPLSRRTSLSILMRSGRPMQNQNQFQSELTSRIAMLHLADELKIPAPNETQLAEYLKTRRAFAGPDGEFSPDAYTRFVDNLALNPQMPANMIVSVLEEDYRLDMISDALGGPGYFLPTEATAQTQRQNTSLTVATAELSFDDFDPEIDPTEEDLKAFFEENKLRYQIDERIKASYVNFESKDFEDKIETPSEADLRQHFAANRAQFVAEFDAMKPPSEQLSIPKIEDLAEQAADRPTTFEDVRDAVLADLTEERAARLANEAALGLQINFYENAVVRDSPAFNQILNAKELSLTPITPYTREATRARLLPAAMLEAAFELDDARYYTDPYPTSSGYALLIYQDKIDPEIPPYETVTAAVKADFLNENKRRLFNEKGESIKSELETKLADGADFTEAAEALGLTAKTFEPFKANSPPPDLSRTSVQEAQGMDIGEISPMFVAGGKGSFVFLLEKEVPELSDESEELEQSKDFLKRYNQLISSSALTRELIDMGLPEEATGE